MKNNHPSRRYVPAIYLGATLGILASGVIVCRAFAADTPTPAPVISGFTTGSATPGVPATGLSVSAGDVQITDPNVIARIENTDITVDEMRATLASLDPDQQAAVAADPAMLYKVVRMILMERVILKEITSKQWDQQPAVKAHLEKVRITTLSEMYLHSVAKPPDDFPSEAELRQAYEDHKAALAVPHQFLTSQIFIAVPADAAKDVNEKAQVRLDAIMKELQPPIADFAAIAKKESDDKLSAQQDGEMGWMNDDKMAPKILSAVRVLAKGAISEPVRLTDGWHILKLVDTKDFSPAAFDDVKEKLADVLRMDRERINRLNYINKLLEEYPVTINDAAVPALLKKAKK